MGIFQQIGWNFPLKKLDRGVTIANGAPQCLNFMQVNSAYQLQTSKFIDRHVKGPNTITAFKATY